MLDSLISDCCDFNPLRLKVQSLADSFDHIEILSSDDMRSWADRTSLLSPALFSSSTSISLDDGLSFDLEAFAVSMCLTEKRVRVVDLERQKDGPRWTTSQWIQYWRRRRRRDGESSNQGVADVNGRSHCVGASIPNPSVVGGFHGHLTRELSLRDNGALEDGDSDLEDEADSAQVKEEGHNKSGVRESFFSRCFGLSCMSLSAFHQPLSGLKGFAHHSDDCVTSNRKSSSLPSRVSLSSTVLVPLELHQLNLLSALNLSRLAQQHPLHHFLSLYPSQSFVNFNINPGGATCWLKVLKGSVTALLVPPTESNLMLYCSWVHCGARDKGLSLLDAPLSGISKACVAKGSHLVVPGSFILAVFFNEDSLLVNSQFLHSKNLPLQFHAWSVEELLKSPQSQRFSSFLQVMWYLASSVVGPISYGSLEAKPRSAKRPLSSKPLRSRLTTRDDMSDFIVSDDDEIERESNASPTKLSPKNASPPAQSGVEELIPQADGSKDEALGEEDAAFLFSMHSFVSNGPNNQVMDLSGRATPSLFPFSSLLAITSFPNVQVDPLPLPLGPPTSLVDDISGDQGKIMPLKPSNSIHMNRKGTEKAPDPSLVELVALGSSRNRNKAPPSLPSKSPLHGSLHHPRPSHFHHAPNPSPTVSCSQSLSTTRPNQIVLSATSLSSLHGFLSQSLIGQDGPYFSGVPLSIRNPSFLLSTLSLKIVSVEVASRAKLAPIDFLPLPWQSLVLQSMAANSPQGHSPCPSGAGTTNLLTRSHVFEPHHSTVFSPQDCLEEVVSSNELDDWDPDVITLREKKEVRSTNWQKKLKI
jgi:hypothetical protein